jgi:hypothetical protein
MGPMSRTPAAGAERRPRTELDINSAWVDFFTYSPPAALHEQLSERKQARLHRRIPPVLSTLRDPVRTLGPHFFAGFRRPDARAPTAGRKLRAGI